jgi:hypothetical protein
MGRQWNTIIESLGPLSGGTMSINANLTEIEALLTTLQADVADGIIVTSGSSVVTNGTLAQVTSASSVLTAGTLTNGTVTASLVNDSGNIVPLDFTSALNDNPPNRGIQIGFSDTNAGAFSFVETTNPLPISGTVTAVPIRGTTTTGTLTAGTTNGTLFDTNSTRNYLLVQCTSGTVFIDTNGTASATDDIQLTAGQGITWEGSFIPTGAIAAITSAGTARIIGVQG